MSEIVNAAISAAITYVASGVNPAAAAWAFALTLAGSVVAKAMPPALDLPEYTAEVRDRNTVVRSGVTARRLIYGEMISSGPLIFAGSTDSNDRLHLVIGLAGHECEAIKSVFLGDQEITEAMLDGDGNVTSGRYANFLRIKKHLGGADQTADSDLVAEVDDWTTDHRLRGVCYLYVRLIFSQDVYPTGIPNIKAVVRGKKVFDTRDDVTRWTRNPALIIRDYLLSDDGIGCISGDVDLDDITGNFDDIADFDLLGGISEIKDSTVTAAANLADEYVTVAAVADTFIADAATEILTRATAAKQFELGDRVRLTTTGTLPGGLALATDYYVAPVTPTGAGVKLATTLANAYSATVINVTGAGSGAHTITKTAQLRYVADGSSKLDAKPIDVMEALLSSCDGSLVFRAGQYHVYGGAATSYSASFDEDILTGPITVQPKFPRRELFNQVRGKITSPYAFWQEADFARVTNATYITEDGETIPRDITLPWTTNATRAQRLAKIVLEKSRQSIVVQMPCNLSAMDVAVHDVIRVTSSKFAWTNKEFRVQQMTFTKTGIDLTLQEYAATAWDWDSGEETEIDSAPDTNLPSAYSVVPPAGLSVAEELYTTRNSAGVKTRAILTWSTSGNADVISYEVRYKESSASAYNTVGVMGEGTTEIPDLAPTTYLFEVRAINALGVRSAFTQLTKEITGLLAPPSPIANLAVQSLGGAAVLTWTQSGDLDVRQGGKIRFRHSNLTTGATWANSVEIGFAAAGSATMTTLPMKAGTYLARAYDSSGISSTVVSVLSDGATILAYSTTATATEHTGFAGAKSDVYVSSNILRLGGEDNLDSFTDDFDDIPDFDLLGGVADVGTYTFANAITLGSVTRCRLVTHIASIISNVREKIDERGLVDDWVDIDNNDAGEADCQIYYRQTQTDPAGSPTWTDWRLVQASEVQGRGFQFKAILTSGDDQWNIGVSEMSVTAQTI